METSSNYNSQEWDVGNRGARDKENRIGPVGGAKTPGGAVDLPSPPPSAQVSINRRIHQKPRQGARTCGWQCYDNGTLEDYCMKAFFGLERTRYPEPKQAISA